MKETHSHSGHRQRIKNRVRKYGLKSLEPHEMLEVLLTYSIPRKDTNSIAHSLLEDFKTISKVVDAETSQLKTINGVGDETILFFNILRDFVDVYLDNKKDEKIIKLDTAIKCVEYFRKHFQFKNNECLYVFCLSKTGTYCHHFVLEGESEDEIEFTFKTLIENIASDKVRKIVIIHTHPKGDISPSLADIQTTERIYSVCMVMGVELADHIIVNETNHLSFKNNNFFNGLTAEQTKQNIAKILSEIKNKTP